MEGAHALPELASVPWRQPSDQRWLRRRGHVWQAWMALYTLPFVVAGVLIFMLEPLALPVSLLAFGHAWVTPEVYQRPGAAVRRRKGPQTAHAEPVAQGLLGDLLAHEP